LGDIEMKHRFAKSTLVLTALAGFASTLPAKSNDWAEPMKLCAANPNCRQEMPNRTRVGAIHFTIHQANSIISIRCEDNGDCRRVFPRGASSSISSLTDLFAVK
jgi:hypothetical protein